MKVKIIFGMLVLTTLTLHAKIKLPQLISDHMVLQQQTEVCLWGEATPNSSVQVSYSWANDKKETKADENGFWKIFIETPSASFKSHTLVISDGEPVTLHNVLIGEVWFCSGQSNMVMPLNGFENCPVRDANNVIADAPNHPAIRVATIATKSALTPQRYANGTWKLPTVDNAPMFSAVAYHYALALQRTLQVPVGIISCAWGGSRVEGWLPKEILQTYENEDLSVVGTDKMVLYMQPMIMYNGMLHPCKNYTVKGFIWYQGESNVDSSSTYAERLAEMVKHWRSLWNQDNLPFYYVEIAPYACGHEERGVKGALLREAQSKALSLIPNSGMVCINDLVEEHEVFQAHPCNKKEIGERLAYQALNKSYGYKGIKSDSPLYKGMRIDGNKIEISFYNAAEGFSPWMGIDGFEIAGANKVFYPAQASINQKDKTIVVTSGKVKNPVAVRYCFYNFRKGNLKNTRNLPVVPFRTDNW